MKQLTENAIGKKMQLMWQNKAITIATIQSKLGGEFLLAGLNQQEAKAGFLSKARGDLLRNLSDRARVLGEQRVT